MTGRIFISYRRGDSQGATGRLFDRLLQHFEHTEVFMDVDDLEPGVDFVKALNDQVANCTAFIAVIGPDWLAATDGAGQRRLDDANDYVRLEIEAALKRDIRVIPVLVDGGRMPRTEDLPESLRPLTRRQAVELTHQRFLSGVDELAASIKRALGKERPREALGSHAVTRLVPAKTHKWQAETQKWTEILFSFKGRISRKTYFLGAVCLLVFGSILINVVSEALTAGTAEEVRVAGFLASIPILWAAWALILKRLHDLGRGWVLLSPIVALGVMTSLTHLSGDTDTFDACLGANVLLGLLIGLFKGTIGHNPYGPDPLGGELQVSTQLGIHASERRAL
jgi:uncharacterized membrane protein YhaH (DUF805 family)